MSFNFKKYLTEGGVEGHLQLEENENLEQKSIAKKVLLIMKKNGLKDTSYQTDTISTKGEKDDNSRVGVTKDGIVMAQVYQFDPGLYDGKNVVGKTIDDADKKKAKAKLGKIYNEIVSVLKDYEVKSGGDKPNEFGFYIIMAKKK